MNSHPPDPCRQRQAFACKQELVNLHLSSNPLSASAEAWTIGFPFAFRTELCKSHCLSEMPPRSVACLLSCVSTLGQGNGMEMSHLFWTTHSQVALSIVYNGPRLSINRQSQAPQTHTGEGQWSGRKSEPPLSLYLPSHSLFEAVFVTFIMVIF